jgi:hypothetical protein
VIDTCSTLGCLCIVDHPRDVRPIGGHRHGICIAGEIIIIPRFVVRFDTANAPPFGAVEVAYLGTFHRQNQNQHAPARDSEGGHYLGRSRWRLRVSPPIVVLGFHGGDYSLRSAAPSASVCGHVPISADPVRTRVGTVQIRCGHASPVPWRRTSARTSAPDLH